MINEDVIGSVSDLGSGVDEMIHKGTLEQTEATVSDDVDVSSILDLAVVILVVFKEITTSYSVENLLFLHLDHGTTLLKAHGSENQ